MPIFIRNPEINRRLDELAARQPVRVTKHALAEAFIERGLEAATANPGSLQKLGDLPAPDPTDQRQGESPDGSVIRNPSSTPARECVSDVTDPARSGSASLEGAAASSNLPAHVAPEMSKAQASKPRQPKRGGVRQAR